MIDIQISNAKFTWIGPIGKRSKLDRALVNSEMAGKTNWNMRALPRKNSDHRGVLLYQEEVDWGPKPFRVFNIWFKVESLIKVMNLKINQCLMHRVY